LAQDHSTAAQGHYGQSMTLCREISYLPGLSKASLGLGKVAWHQEDIGAARTYFTEALQLQCKLGNPYDVAALLEAVATVTADNESDRAVQLLGAADGLRNTMGVVLHLPERAAYQVLIGHLKERLTATAFATAWKAGQSLTLEEALTLALRILASNEPQTHAGRDVAR